MSRRPPSGGMWLPPPGSLSQSTSTFNIQDDPRAGGEATRMAHQLEESFWRNLEQLERQLLQRDQPPAINWRPIARREFEWTEVFAHFVAPSASTQRAALLGQAVQQASRYVARLLLAWIPHVNDISETRRRAMVEAMTSLMDAHVSAGYREQASALHGSGGNMDYGHAQAAVAYTKGLRIINPAFQQLQNSGQSLPTSVRPFRRSELICPFALRILVFRPQRPIRQHAARATYLLPCQSPLRSPQSLQFPTGQLHSRLLTNRRQHRASTRPIFFSEKSSHFLPSSWLLSEPGTHRGHAQDRATVYSPVSRASAGWPAVSRRL